MSGFSFSKLKQAKPSMRRRLFLYMGALAALLLVTLFAVLLLLGLPALLSTLRVILYRKQANV